MTLFALVLTLLAGAGCSDDAKTVLVDLKTDYVSGIEFATVRTSLHSAIPRGGESPLAVRERAAEVGETFLEGTRVAELSLSGSGAVVLRTELLRSDGTVTAMRVSRFAVSEANVGVTVLISRDCSGVTCPASADAVEETECFGGRCVSPDCVEENVLACGVGVCAADADCTGSVACAEGRCVAGACLNEAITSRCAASEYCDPDVGCRPTGGGDAGGDAGMDAAADALIEAGTDAGPTTYDLEGRVYTVAPGLVAELEVPLAESAPLLDSAWPHGLVTPRPGSAFPAGLYLATGMGGTNPPTVFRISGGTVSVFARASGQPATNFNGAAFSPPASAYGDYLYACAYEGGALDGLFRIDPAGTIERFSSHRQCIGLDFDAGGLLGGGTSLYVTMNNDQITRVSAAGVTEVLDTSFPIINGSLQLLVPQAGSFAGELLAVTDGNWDVTGDGFIGRSTGGTPWAPVTRMVEGVDPYGTTVSAAGPFGDVWLVNTGSEVVGYTPAGESSSILTGLGSHGELVLSNDGSTLWVVAADDGRIIRLRGRMAI